MTPDFSLNSFEFFIKFVKDFIAIIIIHLIVVMFDIIIFMNQIDFSALAIITTLFIDYY